VLDDYSVLRGLDADALAAEAVVFPIRRAWLYTESRPLGRGGKAFQGDSFHTAPNPEVGAVVRYHLRELPKTRRQDREAAEAAARKAGEDIRWPSWDELRQ